MKARRIIGAVVFWALTLSIMYIAFGFSSETAAESEQVSQGVLDIIIEHLGIVISHHMLRKIAHFSEYAALGFCMGGAIYFTFNKNKFYIPLIPSVIYAASDEIHQLFVPERSCEFLDVIIDSCGSSFGILIFMLILLIINRIKSKKAQSVV